MRTLVLSLLGAALLLAGIPPALAQDEFGDEFADEPAAPAEPAPPVGRDEGYDRFSEEDLAEDEHYRPSEPGEPGEEAFEQAFRAHNSWYGPVGGVHVVDAGSGALGSFRVQLGIGFFDTGDFLVREDSTGWVGGALSLSWTPFEMLELYASLASHATSNDRESPDLFLVLGDARIGGKVFTDLSPWLRLGGDLRLFLPTGVNLGIGDGLGFSIGALLTADLRGLEEPVPFIARLDLAYRFDQTEKLIGHVESRRYDALDDALPAADETRHLVSPVERFALGINRTDFLDLGIGLEAPLRAAEDLYIHPLAEWTLGIPINRQGYSCLITEEALDDGCLDEVGISAYPMTLTLGVRVLPPVRGLAALAAIDIGLTGTSAEDAVRELAANAPWKLILGLSYAFDTRPRPEPEVIVREVERRVDVQADEPPTGRVLGSILEEGSAGVPVRGAIVALPSHPERNALAADGQGRFATYRLPPGDVQMAITAEGYEPGACAATIPEEGGDVQVQCELAKIAAQVQVEEGEVVVLEKIHFAFDSAEILAQSFGLMQEIANTLNEHPELVSVEIQGHTDTQGTPDYNLQLSQRRAESVRQWLVDHGVAPARLEARGYGQNEPVASNDTEEGRARNRRVSFIIKNRAD